MLIKPPRVHITAKNKRMFIILRGKKTHLPILGMFPVGLSVRALVSLKILKLK